jgi:hypothetical protein
MGALVGADTPSTARLGVSAPQQEDAFYRCAMRTSIGLLFQEKVGISSKAIFKTLKPSIEYVVGDNHQATAARGSCIKALHEFEQVCSNLLCDVQFALRDLGIDNITQIVHVGNGLERKAKRNGDRNNYPANQRG